MADNKMDLVSRRFQADCLSWGYESKKSFGLDAEVAELELVATVPATPDSETQLKQAAERLAKSIWTDTIKECVFKRFLSSAEQVFSPQSQLSAKERNKIFTPNYHRVIQRQARWYKSTVQQGEAGDLERIQRFAIPFVPNENPIDTARRLVKEVLANGEAMPRQALQSADIQLAYDFNPQEIELIRKALELERQEEELIERQERDFASTLEYYPRGETPRNMRW